jgi:hypothetical protein
LLQRTRTNSAVRETGALQPSSCCEEQYSEYARESGTVRVLVKTWRLNVRRVGT